MKILVILFFFTFFILNSKNVNACFSCVHDVDFIILKKATPKFPKDFRSDKSIAEITITFDHPGSKKGAELENIRIIKKVPSDIADSVIYDFLERSKIIWIDESNGKRTIFCGGKDFKLSFDLSIPQQLAIEKTIEIKFEAGIDNSNK